MTDHKHHKANGSKNNLNRLWVTLIGIILIAAGVCIYLNPCFLGWVRGKVGSSTCYQRDKHTSQTQAVQGSLKDIHTLLLGMRSQLHQIKESQNALEQRLNKLEDHPMSSLKLEDNQEKFLKDLTTSLEDRLKELEKRLLHEINLKEALRSFSYRLWRGKPFLDEYNILKSCLSEEQQALLSPLEPYTSIGIPKFETLEKDFEQVKTEMLTGEPIQGTWWQKAIHWVKSLVIVQKKEKGGQNLLSHLEEIQHQLKLRNVQDALRQSQELKISSPLKEAWEQHAQAYVDAYKAMKALSKTSNTDASSKDWV